MSEKGTEAQKELVQEERRIGIHRIPTRHGFEIETQVIEIGKLNPQWFDPRLGLQKDLQPLVQSDAHRWLVEALGKGIERGQIPEDKIQNA